MGNESGVMLVVLLLLISGAKAEPHAKTKCSLECYALCMQSGTSLASSCNCPVSRDPSNCTRFDRDLQTTPVSTTIPKTRSEYVDAHMIRVSIEPQPTAFAYVFEYSTISTEPDNWNFAGASARPEAVFSILDPCRDYQFRVIIVVRSANPAHVFDIIRPQPIPVQLPPFILTQQQISIEMPRVTAAHNYSEDLKLYVKWTLPSGYIDGDIYSYESPALYPIQCSTPEGEIPTPRIEIVKGGGRLAVWLPPSVLEARCRMWVEVKMLPRCVRLEPFNIQKNIEIDCSKNPNLEVCSKESNPVCYETVTVSGDHGKAKISWQTPERAPLYYHVRYGPAESKGVAPFVTWQLAAKREVRVDGSLSSFSLDIPEDEDFGVQVCAILSKKRKRPKFGVIQVIPFQCSSCKTMRKSLFTPLTIQVSLPETEACGDCGPIIGSTVLEKDWKDKTPPKKHESTVVPRAQTSTVYRMETDLSVSGNGIRNEPHVKVKSGTRHSTDSPINLEKAEEINKKTLEASPEPSTTVPPPTTQTTTTKVVTTTVSTTTPATTTETHSTRRILSEEIEKSVENLEKAIEESVKNGNEMMNNRTAEAVDQIDRELEKSEVRHHEKAKKCLTSDGVVCEFGCEDRKTCICPSATHARLINGICASRETMLHTICLPRREINATWDSESGNIMVRRSDALYHIEHAEFVDKLFVEFGKVDVMEETMNETKIEFNDTQRSKIVVMIQTVLKSSVFSTEPFIFHVNQTIDMNTTYGMRFCVFNSSQIRSPHNYNWDDVSRFEKNEQIAEVIQLSPVRFTNKLPLQYQNVDTYWTTVMTIAKISILVILAIAIFILVYLNCTKFRTLYDRKRTHYFRPFYIDPSVSIVFMIKGLIKKCI
uniref:Fibronectin type-III domain-containing protein n=1 Tax=Caenorhabditis tropicalis TaxID=1561998 RepID=A0A1I7UBA3_9PELO